MRGDALEIRFGQLENAADGAAVLVRHPVGITIADERWVKIPAQGRGVEMTGLFGFLCVQFVPPDAERCRNHAILPHVVRVVSVPNSRQRGKLTRKPGRDVARKWRIVAVNDDGGNESVCNAQICAGRALQWPVHCVKPRHIAAIFRDSGVDASESGL